MPDPRQNTENAGALAVPQRRNAGPGQHKTGAPGRNPDTRRSDHRRPGRVHPCLHVTGRARMKNRRTPGTVPLGHPSCCPGLSSLPGLRRFRNDRRDIAFLFRNLEGIRCGGRNRIRNRNIGRRFRLYSRCSNLPAIAAVRAAQPLDPFCQRLRNLKDRMTVGAFNAHSINPFDSRLRSGLA